MIIAIVTLVISFLYEGFISNYITSYFNNYNIFTTLYTLIALVVLLPYFANKKKYYILLLIFGYTQIGSTSINPKVLTKER